VGQATVGSRVTFVSECFESSDQAPGAGGRWPFAEVVAAEVTVGLDLAVVDVGTRNAPLCRYATAGA
jgi:hypothetical protein